MSYVIIWIKNMTAGYFTNMESAFFNLKIYVY